MSVRDSNCYMSNQNEKRKDKDLTQRIERILQQRDEALKGVDLSPCFIFHSYLIALNLCATAGSIERKVDHLVCTDEHCPSSYSAKTQDPQLVELEAERDLSQIIVHVDMDAFYANVELLDNPTLAQKPFGVCPAI